MLTPDNKYTTMQRNQYDSTVDQMAIANHKQHNPNPDYWNVLLGQISKAPNAWQGKTALDFGCGHGRNIENLLRLAPFNRVDGCDISSKNIQYAGRYVSSCGIPQDKFTLYTTNGVELNGIPTDEYDFVMSTIVFQHICVHDIRYALMKDIYRVLKPGGLFSLQMGYGPKAENVGVGYYDNFFDATSTNSGCDVCIDNPSQPINDLMSIGFKNIEHTICNPWCDTHSKWIYLKGTK